MARRLFANDEDAFYQDVWQEFNPNHAGRTRPRRSTSNRQRRRLTHDLLGLAVLKKSNKLKSTTTLSEGAMVKTSRSASGMCSRLNRNAQEEAKLDLAYLLELTEPEPKPKREPARTRTAIELAVNVNLNANDTGSTTSSSHSYSNTYSTSAETKPRDLELQAGEVRGNDRPLQIWNFGLGKFAATDPLYDLFWRTNKHCFTFFE